MAGRTPAEAVGAFLAPLQQALDCLTPTVLNVSGGYYVADRPHALTLGDGDPVALSGEHHLALSVAQNYRLVEFEGPRGPWKVQTTAYFYLGEVDAAPRHDEHLTAPQVPAASTDQRTVGVAVQAVGDAEWIVIRSRGGPAPGRTRVSSPSIARPIFRVAAR